MVNDPYNRGKERDITVQIMEVRRAVVNCLINGGMKR